MASLYEEIVDAMNALHGAHPGYRAAHAKGTVVRGGFTPAPAAKELSRAAHLQGDPVEVTARFSNGSGDPEARDCDRRDGRGLAVKFQIPGGEATDIVSVSLPVFFVRNGEDFLAFLRAREPDPESGEMDMEKIGAFMAEHPETAAAVQLILPALAPPPSFANSRYNGLHAFGFTNPGGERRFGRYSWLPEAGEALLPDEEIDATSRDFLQEEIRERLGSGPVAFTLQVQLAGDGDAIEDPTVAWPEERETVELGRLELNAVVDESESEAPDAPLVFDPVNVIDGIECSEDKILATRSKAYAVSIERRMAAGRA
ncbi:MAG: catalase family peroxidase [Solirubrobacterales bacterium]